MRRHAFTLIELLVVVAIIALLIAILLPSLAKARDTARDLKCRTNLRTISIAFFMFANDHKMVLPGGFQSKVQGSQQWQKGWMGKEVDPNNRMGWTRLGTLLPYVGDSEDSARELYRCPGLEFSEFNTGFGSNGMFDYSSVLNFAGANINVLNNDATATIPATGLQEHTNTPLILEEAPSAYINLIHVEYSWGSVDALANTHLDGGNFVGADGAVQRLVLHGQNGPTSFDWTVRAPSGKYIPIAPDVAHFAGWNER